MFKITDFGLKTSAKSTQQHNVILLKKYLKNTSVNLSFEE